jgi:HK97 family phage portal protein
VKIFGLTITRTKAAPNNLQSVESQRGWWPIVREPFAGAWQRNIEITLDTVLTCNAVYACVSLIASDIAKMRVRLVAQDANGIWNETDSPSFSPVLRKPNRYQTRVKFFEWWITSKLIHGNAYALKQRDNRGVVTTLYLLDPCRVRPLVAPDGSVFYALKTDNLSGLNDDVVVPASEIIHDIMCALYHPLVGVSPIHACGLAAMQCIKIQNNSALFFENGSQPGGVLTAPGAISDPAAKRIKQYWETEFSGNNVGKVAVLGDGLKYEPMTINAHDSQLIEQLKWTAETVCSCFHVPPYMIGVGPTPTYNNIEALNQQYYSQCLQTLIESLEICLDEGLELPKPYGTEFDLDDLLRMDTATRVKAAADAIGSGAVAPNEARRRWLDLGPVTGGQTPYLQQQNYSLEALNKRDRQADPFAKPSTPAAPALPAADDSETQTRGLEAALFRKATALARTYAVTSSAA